MKKMSILLAGAILAVLILVPSCRKEIYTDEDALAAMKEAIKYKNDLEKELLSLQLTNELQLAGLLSQLSMKETRAADSLEKAGAKVAISIQVQDVTGRTTDMSGFSIVANQSGVAVTKTTDANGFVVFPDCISGTASFVATKDGFARAAGILLIGTVIQNAQKAIVVPVFPTNSETAKINGVLSAQLDLTTAVPEPVKDGIISLSFDNIWNMFYNPNSTMVNLSEFGLAALTYDGGFMQTIRTGADGKYEFKIPKTKNNITYDFNVSTIQKKQKLLYGDYPALLDTMRLDSVSVYFGYDRWAGPFRDGVGFEYNYGSFTSFQGLNITIDPPTGGQTPTAPAAINWAHNDSTVVTWSFTKFAFGNGSSEFTDITQNPVFDFDPDPAKVVTITPTAGTINITNGKVISLYMTNGGQYKEYGRFWDENIAPTQATGTKFKFFEELSDEDAGNWTEDTTYQTAKATATVILHKDRVKVAFNMSNDVTAHRKGKGYTAIPNVEVYLDTPNTTDSLLTQNDLKVNLLPGGSLSIDTLVLAEHYTSTTGFFVSNPVFSTYKKDGWTQNYYSDHWISATPSSTYRVDLLNGFKIADGGLGYSTAPKVRVQNYARKQGTTGSFVQQTIAEANTTLDASGRIIAVSDPVMLDNFEIQYWSAGSHYYFNSINAVSIPVNVAGLTQALARARVDEFGTITSILLYNEDLEEWLSNTYGASFVSGKGYVVTPKVKVRPVGKTSVTRPAVLQAVVNSTGKISNVIIVDGGKGYDVRNNENAMEYPGDLNSTIETNGSSDFVYNINMGSGWHGDPNDIF